MVSEYIPPTLGYGSAHARAEWQGAPPSCKHFGVTAALEFMAARAGFPVQLSARYLWWHTRGRTDVGDIEGVVALVNRVSVCEDLLYPYSASFEPPYQIADVEIPPSHVANIDAEKRAIKMKTCRIAGKVEIMRALAQGHGVITVRTWAEGGEHAECLIDYHETLGALVCGSTGAIFWEPWDSFGLGGCMTQVHRVTQAPWKPVPHPDYVEGDLPTLNGSILTLPKASIWAGWGADPRWLYFKNVQLNIVSVESVSSDNDDVRAIVFWHAELLTLFIPKLVTGGVVLDNVKIIKPVATLITAEEDLPKETS
jgi:hypothetical protein